MTTTTTTTDGGLSAVSMHPMTTRLRRPTRAIVIPLLFGALAAGCGGDGVPTISTPGGSNPPAATDAPAGTTPPTEAPAETAPPTDAPTEPETTTPGESDDGDNTLLVVILIVGGLALLIALFAMLGRRGKQQPAPQVHDPRSQMASTTRWLHDQLSLELLSLPPHDAQQRWASQRPRLDQLSIDLRAEATRHDPEIWAGTATSVDALVSSLDTAVRVRASDDANQTIVDESVAVANRHRGELQTWLVAAEQSIIRT